LIYFDIFTSNHSKLFLTILQLSQITSIYKNRNKLICPKICPKIYPKIYPKKPLKKAVKKVKKRGMIKLKNCYLKIKKE